MSDTDSFIDEVTEEVRRDKLYANLKKYGWIGVLGVVLIVGGAAWREYSKAQETAKAQAFGDALVSALETETAADRVAALSEVEAPSGAAEAIKAMLIGAEQAASGDDAASSDTMAEVGTNTDAPEIYRQIATFKALSKPDGSLSDEERRAAFEAMTQPGHPLRLLSQEQLALIEVKAGDTEAAITRLQAILTDDEATQGLRRRATQLIVSLGGSLVAGE